MASPCQWTHLRHLRPLSSFEAFLLKSRLHQNDGGNQALYLTWIPNSVIYCHYFDARGSQMTCLTSLAVYKAPE